MESLNHLEKGRNLFNTGNLEEAILECNIAYQLAEPSEKFETGTALSTYYLSLQKYEESIKILKELIDIFPQEEIIYMSLFSAYSCSKKDGLEEILLKGIEKVSESFDLYLALSDYYFDKHNRNDAEKMINKIVDVYDPKISIMTATLLYSVFTKYNDSSPVENITFKENQQSLEKSYKLARKIYSDIPPNTKKTKNNISNGIIDNIKNIILLNLIFLSVPCSFNFVTEITI